MKFLVLVVVLCLSFVKNDASGVVYTRWGRTVCDSGAEVVYTGYMAGSHNKDTGGGGNYLCMDQNPSDDGERLNTAQEVTVAAIHGVEYRLYNTHNVDYKPFSFGNNNYQSFTNHNAPCVVCHRHERDLKVMIPGRHSCRSDNMKQEYSGFLMALASSNAGNSQFICVDGAPETIPGTSAANADSALNVAEVRCSSLPCPPYANGNEVPCVVCTF